VGVSEYKERDPEALGEAYIRHVDAMTSESLHSKAGIAAELACRDNEIEHWKGVVTRLRRERDAAETKLSTIKEQRDRYKLLLKKAKTQIEYLPRTFVADKNLVNEIIEALKD